MGELNCVTVVGIEHNQTTMEFHTLQSTPMGRLNCVIVVGIEHLECPNLIQNQTTMEFHTLQSTRYGEAELRDSCRD